MYLMIDNKLITNIMNSFEGISQIKNNHLSLFIFKILSESFNYAGHVSIVDSTSP